MQASGTQQANIEPSLSKRTLSASVAWSHPAKTAAREALKVVRRAEPFGALTVEHRRWWHDRSSRCGGALGRLLRVRRYRVGWRLGHELHP